MSGVTVRQSDTISAMLELYSERLESLRADMRAAHEQAESLAADFRSLLETAMTAEQAAMQNDPTSSVEPFATRDPEVGSEIEILVEAGSAGTLEQDELASIAGEAAAAPVSGSDDDLTTIDGIDSAAAEALQGFGIGSYSALAAIDNDEATVIGMVLGDAERVEREGWIEQASAMASEPPSFGLDTSAVTLNASSPELPPAFTAQAKASDGSEIATPKIPVAIDPVFEDIFIDQDPTTRQLILAAATLAKTVAAEKERERTQAISAPSATLIEFGPAAAAAAAAATGAGAETKTEDKAAAPAALIDLAARRSAWQHRRRPRAIAASLVVLLIAGIAVGATSDQILGFDLSTVATCGEELLLGNTSCIELPASF